MTILSTSVLWKTLETCPILPSESQSLGKTQPWVRDNYIKCNNGELKSRRRLSGKRQRVHRELREKRGRMVAKQQGARGHTGDRPQGGGLSVCGGKIGHKGVRVGKTLWKNCFGQSLLGANCGFITIRVKHWIYEERVTLLRFSDSFESFCCWEVSSSFHQLQDFRRYMSRVFSRNFWHLVTSNCLTEGFFFAPLSGLMMTCEGLNGF